MGFILSWTPYAFVAFYAAFIAGDLSPLGGTLPAMFAKSAFVWSSAIFLYSNKKARRAIFGKPEISSGFSDSNGSASRRKSINIYLILVNLQRKNPD